MTTTTCGTPDHLACVPVTIELHLTDEFVRDVYVNAIEGGINYWASVGEYWHSNPDPAKVYALVEERDGDAPLEHRITLDTVVDGIKAVLAKPQLRTGLVAHIMALDAGEIDADDADVIVQLGLFEEVVYG